jgi:hypothetical protein
LAAGCGGSHAKRNAIRSYIDRINVVERLLATPFANVSKANVSFAKAKKHDPKLNRKLLASEHTMHALSQRLAAISAPPEAAPLRALLLEVVNRQLTLTHEVHQLYTFVPAFQAALTPLTAADAKLSTALRSTRKTTVATNALDAEKAAELRSYSSIAGGVILKLRHLQPPPVWRPGYTVQLTSLQKLRTIALELAGAIGANKAAALPNLLQRFDRAAVAARTLAAQEAQRSAVLAYNRRIHSLVTLTHKINQEENRLEKVYG